LKYYFTLKRTLSSAFYHQSVHAIRETTFCTRKIQDVQV